MPRFKMQLHEAPAGGGGYLEAAGAQLQLSVTQYAMLATLIARMTDEVTVAPVVRGFVPFGPLIDRARSWTGEIASRDPPAVTEKRPCIPAGAFLYPGSAIENAEPRIGNRE